MLAYQLKSEFASFDLIAGIDEAGCGPWAGPVVAAAVILPKGYQNEEINDSKQLTAACRERLFAQIQKDALAIGVGVVEAIEIDRTNILMATKAAMTIAIGQLQVKPDFLLIDAVKLVEVTIPQEAVIHGDALALPIAAASIVAKVHRDHLMVALHERHPEYRFDLHKGYGTALHQERLARFGPLAGIHRFSYKPIKNYL
ncbi:MAG: ribonuclease HII [Bacilli bacterium]